MFFIIIIIFFPLSSMRVNAVILWTIVYIYHFEIYLFMCIRNYNTPLVYMWLDGTRGSWFSAWTLFEKNTSMDDFKGNRRNKRKTKKIMARTLPYHHPLKNSHFFSFVFSILRARHQDLLLWYMVLWSIFRLICRVVLLFLYLVFPVFVERPLTRESSANVSNIPPLIFCLPFSFPFLRLRLRSCCGTKFFYCVDVNAEPLLPQHTGRPIMS